MAGKRQKQRIIRKALFSGLGGWFGGSEVNDSELFLLFNHAVVGGADLVHARVAQAVADLNPWVYFTLPTWPQPFVAQFPDSARVEYVGRKCTSHARRFFHLGRLAAIINRHKNPTVLGGNSRFFYELTAMLGLHVRCIDLCHALASVEHFSLPFVENLDTRVFISDGVREQFAHVYDEEGIEPELNSRMTVIENCVDVPSTPPLKPNGKLNVLFVGRGAPEKRVHLVGQIAAECAKQGIESTFTLIGDCEEHVAPEDRQHCRFLGLIDDPAEVQKHYAEAHVLLITSSSEGFPVVVMEAMAAAVVPVCTNVGGIPNHVIPKQTGVLLSSDESKVVEAAVSAIKELSENRSRLAGLASATHLRAMKYFSPERFNTQWRELLMTKTDSEV